MKLDEIAAIMKNSGIAGAGGAGAENTAAKGGAKNFKPLQSEDFDAPPLMDEPVYGDDQ